MRTVLPLLLLLSASPAFAQSFCEHPPPGHTWPGRGESEAGAPTSEVSLARARAMVRRARGAWRRHRVVGREDETACMLGSYESFVVRRVLRSSAERRLAWLSDHGFTANLLQGGALEGPWVWEVYWGGSSRRRPPSGPVSVFLAADETSVLAVAHWPEG